MMNRIARVAFCTLPLSLCDTQLVFAQSASSVEATPIVRFQSAISGASPRSYQDKLSDIVNIKEFGARCDGAADDAAAIQRASDSGASTIEAPENATCLIHSTINLRTSNQIFDLKGSTLLLDDSTGHANAIMLGTGIIQTNNVTIRNGVVKRVQHATAGYAIDSNYTAGIVINNMTLYGGEGAATLYNGIRIRSGINWNVYHNHIHNVANDGFYIDGTNSTTHASIDINLKNNRLEKFHNGIVTWNYTEGLFLQGNIVYNGSGTGVSISASSPKQALSSFLILDNDVDTLTERGWYIQYARNVQFNNNWVSNTGSDAITIGHGAQSIVVSGCQIYPKSDGIHVGGSYVSVTGNYISGGTKQIVVDAKANAVSIKSNMLNFGQIGIDASANPSNLSVTNNDIYNVAHTPLSTGTGKANVVAANKGDTTVGKTAYVTVGPSPFTYTSGSRPEFINLFSGSVTRVTIGANEAGNQTNTSYMLAPNTSMTITYSSAPRMLKTYPY
ncbi:right-handed parallel beta-helix repeat-containing protein [Burkholderia cenocepacia]|uniref:right-handed parallel beta-helix repeat-containing protein n=1 Tax=Burkholderia cenocepacia TaxID=95486 RepID=UPI001AA137CF|nr:right-handed parallel beta-helix repeat-containing protein [Burkholderia cenocepacia]MBO1855161.1 right-handed parallel beta-helix repeat-containing protein [Burkholderia cenocepacia]MBR8407765.1 right-handed parallel beta-helix repeat-containing protein [Burkholderia cenocepacia]MDR5641736.1 right-handed parallel beta-helix repeat-containing protein [Burkholderia cenocepacia]MDR8051314.1 right-handed parallel beta-helix repeat-containing protein [Burkholderia cenocepacia]